MATSLWMIENTVYNECTGEIYSDRTWTYKIIGAKDIPYDFRVLMNPDGILGSKGYLHFFIPTCWFTYFRMFYEKYLFQIYVIHNKILFFTSISMLISMLPWLCCSKVTEGCYRRISERQWL